MNKEQIILLMKEKISDITKKDINTIDETSSFFCFGISSLDALKTVEYIKHSVDVELDPLALFKYPTIETFAEYVCSLDKENN